MNEGRDDSDIEEYFDRIIEDIQEVYGHSLSEREARQAAHNLVGFVRTLLEIQAENCHNDG